MILGLYPLASYRICVVVDGELSDFVRVMSESEVSQETVLGSLMLPLYINGISENLTSHT